MAKDLRLTAKNESSEMYAAFDLSFDNIQLQMRRQHDKVKDHKGRRYGLKESGQPEPVED